MATLLPPSLDDAYRELNAGHIAQYGVPLNRSSGADADAARMWDQMQSLLGSRMTEFNQQQGTNYDPFPSWVDFWNSWNNSHIGTYGIPMDREWNADADAMRAKAAIDKSYMDAVNEWNSRHGTTFAPDESVLGPNAQFTGFIPKPQGDGFLGGSILGTVAGIGLAPFTGGSSLLMGGLGGAIGGGIQGGDFMSALKGGLLGAGAGGLWGGLGAEGLGTVMIDGVPIDLSGYFTGVDAGGGLTTLTSGLEEDFDWSKLGGVDDFGMDTLPGLIDGPVRTTAEGMATSFGGSIPPWLESVFTPGTNSARLLGQLGSSALGAYGANQQANAFKDASSQYFNMGAPFRNLLQQSYQPGFNLENEPGFKNAMDVGLNTFMRSASAGNVNGVSSGNPYSNPGALMEAQKYLTGSLALPYLTNYRSGLTGAGQLGIGPSAQFTGNQIQSQGGVYDALGYGLQGVLNPKPDYTREILDIMRSWKPNTGSTNV